MFCSCNNPSTTLCYDKTFHSIWLFLARLGQPLGWWSFCIAKMHVSQHVAVSLLLWNFSDWETSFESSWQCLVRCFMVKFRRKLDFWSLFTSENSKISCTVRVMFLQCIQTRSSCINNVFNFSKWLSNFCGGCYGSFRIFDVALKRMGASIHMLDDSRRKLDAAI